MYPYSQVALPSQFTLPSQTTLSSSQTALPSQIPAMSEKSIPKIDEFLQNLDNEYGEGKFTCLLDSFLNESIDVLDILELNDNDFIQLGVNSIGIRKKLVRSAKNYT
jgi:SAM domain (Sterile alpha motif)